jgi:hypothetical protein
MILSRFLARRRIEAGTRPSFLAAWGLVVVDFVLVMAVVIPVALRILAWAEAGDLATIPAILALLFLFFVPMQVLLILSGLWASRSRWVDEGEPG